MEQVLPNHRLCVAPMMDWTDRHCRYFHRLLAPSAWLYTEMVTTGAVIHGDRDRLLAHHPEERPVALQLGGSEPDELAESAKIAAAYGYDEINLNVGCPSDRVQKGRFGACLMLEPERVRDCLSALREAVSVPVSIKCRLGVDEHYSYDFFRDFVGRVTESGVNLVIAHARIARLSGLSPKENREVPPLHHDWVHRLKRELPELEVVINGGIDSAGSVKQQLGQVDGVMLGRAAYQNPWLLARCQQMLWGGAPADRTTVVRAFEGYLARQVAAGIPVKHLTRHLLGLFQGRPGAKHWRRYLSQHAYRDDRNVHILDEALQAVKTVVADAA
jgi:tRNA-dihydrouridine synthase A